MRVYKTLALLLALLAASTHDLAAETLKVAVAQRGFWNSTFIDVGLKQGYFKEVGLDIEILYTEGGASTLTPVIAGSIDIAMTNGTLGVIAAYAKGMPVKIISAEATGAPDAFWYARPESGIKSLADTAGKTVAFSSPGSSTNLILLQLVNQAKVAPKLVATGGAPGTLTQVMSGQIDVGWSVPPFVLQQLAEGRLAIIARGSDVAALAQQTIRVNVANANALKKSATPSCATSRRSAAPSTGPIPIPARSTTTPRSPRCRARWRSARATSSIRRNRCSSPRSRVSTSRCGRRWSSNTSPRQ